MSDVQGGSQLYEKKLEKLQQYVPFLRKMITKLERSNNPERASQLHKMKHLHGILTDSSRKLKYELLVKCEDVLQKLHEKIEGEVDDDVMELPMPARPAAAARPQLYPESEWERPSPPRETQSSQASTSSSSSISRPMDDVPTHSPPLSTFVERIRMSSPSNHNDMDQPRSPSPEVVAQIPGAFAGADRSDKKFERGREILRKLMVGMSKTLDQPGVESPPELDIPSTGPKIIPLERTSEHRTPDSEPAAIDHVDDCFQDAVVRSHAPRSSVVSEMSGHSDAYNPEDEWSSTKLKSRLRPHFMAKPPLSEADLEELNRDLGTGSSHSMPASDKRRVSKGNERPRQRSDSKAVGEHRDKIDMGSELRASSSKSKLAVKEGETLADAQRRQFEEWKKAEVEKYRERRKKQKAELKHSSHGRSHQESRSSSHAHRNHSGDHASSHKSGTDTLLGSLPSSQDNHRRNMPARVDSSRGEKSASTSKDPKANSSVPKDKGKVVDPALKKVSEQLRKYSVQDLIKTVQQGMSPIPKKHQPDDDLIDTYKCLLLRNVPQSALRQDIFRFFQGFGMVELVLEVDFSFACTGIAYAQLVDHAEAQRAKQELDDKAIQGKHVKISPCGEGIFKEAKRTYAQAMNAREEQYAKRQVGKPHPTTSPIVQYPHQPQPLLGYQPQYPDHGHAVGVRPSRPSDMGFGQRPMSQAPGVLGYAPRYPCTPMQAQIPKFQQHGMVPRPQAPIRPSVSKQSFYNPYDVQPGKNVSTNQDPRLSNYDPRSSNTDPRIQKSDPRLAKSDARPAGSDRRQNRGDPRLSRTDPKLGQSDPRQYKDPVVSKIDPRLAAKASFDEQQRHKREKELDILRKRKEEREKMKKREEALRKANLSPREKPVSSTLHKAASFGSFKIPKLKRQESVEESTKKDEDSEVGKPMQSQEDKGSISCHQEDIVSSTVDNEELLCKKKRKRTRIFVISDSESDCESSKPAVTISDEDSFHAPMPENIADCVKETSTAMAHGRSSRHGKEGLIQPPKKTPDKKSAKDSDSDEYRNKAIGSESKIACAKRGTTHEEKTQEETLLSTKKKPCIVLTRATADEVTHAEQVEPIPRDLTESSHVSSKDAEVTSLMNPASSDTEASPIEATPSTSIEVVATDPAPTDTRSGQSPTQEAAVITTDPESSEVAPSPSASPVSKKPEKEPRVEPGECEYCPYNGKKIIFHYVVSHPGNPISVKLNGDAFEAVLNEELGPGDDSAKVPLSQELENKLVNDDLSWIPPSLMFDYTVACQYCKFLALNKRHMLQHIADHLQTGTSAPDQYSMKCRFCKVKSSNSHDMVDHISSHTGEYRYSCRHCGYRVFRMYFLKNHMGSMHKGLPADHIAIEEADISNGWVYGFACKLCGYIQIHERNVKKHMNDCHEGSSEYVKINMSVRGPAVDISRKVSDALKRRKVQEKKRLASLPRPIEDITVFSPGDEWLKEESAVMLARRASMEALRVRYADKLKKSISEVCSGFINKVKDCEETPLQYLEAMRQSIDAEQQEKLSEDEPVSQEVDHEDDGKKTDDESDEAVSEPPDEDFDDASTGDGDQPSLPSLLAELMAVRRDDPAEFGYQVTVKLAGTLRSRSGMGEPERELEPEPSDVQGIAVKQEPVDEFSAESDARAAAGLSSMTADLESLMQDFDQFEKEHQSRPKLRIRKMSGDMLSADDPVSSDTGLIISSVMSLTSSDEPASGQPAADARKPDDGLFSFPPEGARRPWKYFLTLKDQTKVMRLMFHMHHKSAYKCNAVHCSLTTNNGTLFKLHLRNHEKCDICSPQETGYTCMNTRLVCVYCGYQGADLAEHVYRRHAVSQFQCGYCFYRTRQNAYMHEHQGRWHADMPTYFLQSDPANPPPGLNSSHLQETEMVGESSLTPYICAQDSCDRPFIKAAVLEQHYRDAHPDVASFPCHICGFRAGAFRSLIGHYVGHGYVAYHCAYCSFANQNQNVVKKHLIDFHPDDPPKCYARIPKAMGLDLLSAVPRPSSSVAAPSPVKHEPSWGPASPTSASEAAAGTCVKQELERPPSDPPAVEMEEAGESAAESAPPQTTAPAATTATKPATEDESAEQLLLGEDLYRCGNPRCNVRCATLATFKEHVLTCPLTEAGVLLCYHCPKQVKHVSTALEHIRLHGPKRYSCSLCDFSAPVPSYVTKHLKQQHRMSGCSTLPLQPDRVDPERDQFVVYPRQLVPRAEQPPAASGTTSYGFGVDDVDQLPHRPVLFRPLHCKLCSFSSKVTRNLLKHLMCHRRRDAALVPSVCPTNPRPCDHRGEKMFDQMANLASSSGEVGTPRKKADLNPTDVERLPKEVSEDKRYICSLPNCNYLTLNDTMLKYHIQALHGQMITYPCPHCKDLYMIPDKLSTHLRLHGPRLYKCKYCIYNHYQRSLVTRHVRDKHPMLPLVDVVVREPEDDQTTAKPTFKSWRCGLCKYQSVTQPEVVDHAAAVHDLRSQYKCGLCSVRSSVRSAFDLHFAAKHPDESVKVFAIYYRLDPADAEAAAKVEHCRPIWQRNNPRRIRHVRGILIEEVKVSRVSPSKRARVAGSRRSAVGGAGLRVKRSLKKELIKAGKEPAKGKAPAHQARRRALKRALRQPPRRLRARPDRRLRPAASTKPETADESPESPEESPESPEESPESPEESPESPEESPEPAKGSPKPAEESPEPAEESQKPAAKSNRVKVESAARPMVTHDEFLSLYETRSRELGPLGDAAEGMFVCPKCNKYKSKRKVHFSKHLYKELGYNRFVCGNCGHMNTTMVNMRRHHDMAHKQARVPEAIVPLTPDRELEQWIQSVLDHQEHQITGTAPTSKQQTVDTKPDLKCEPKQELPAQQPTDQSPVTPETSAPSAAPAEVPSPSGDSKADLVYKCCYCEERDILPMLRVHWRAQHVNMRFKVVLKQARRFACHHCSFSTSKLMSMRGHLADEHPDRSATDFQTHTLERETRFKCGWCKERFKLRDKAVAHQRVFHSHLDEKIEVYTARAPMKIPVVPKPAANAEESSDTQCSTVASSRPVVKCPLCSHTTRLLKYMDIHLLIHYKRFKCELCGFTDGSRRPVVVHHSRKHCAEPEQIVLLAHLDQEYQKMKRMLRNREGRRAASPTPSDATTSSHGSKRPSDVAAHEAPAKRAAPSSGGVARKSTARARASRATRAVAVKSTGGARRGPAAPFSYYGCRPPSIDNYTEVTTQLTLGGAAAMRVNVPTLAQIVKLYPRCLCVDLRANPLHL